MDRARSTFALTAALVGGCGRVAFDPLMGSANGDGGGGDGTGETDGSPACELGPWSAPSPIAAINTGARESEPSLSPDGKTLVFMSDRATTTAGLNLWQATRASTADSFGTPTLLLINSSSDDGEPAITGDGNTVLFE